jgi:hypothetical protein
MCKGASSSGSMNLSGKVSKKRLIIMDEVDGMGGNEDRGGVQELIAIIKKSKVVDLSLIGLLGFMYMYTCVWWCVMSSYDVCSIGSELLSLLF